MKTFTIGNHIFLTLSIIDATYEAVAKARELFRAGARPEAEALYREALNLRRIEENAWPVRNTRVSVRPSARFRRPGR